MGLRRRQLSVATQVIERLQLGEQVAGGSDRLSLGGLPATQFSLKLSLKLLTHRIALTGQLLADPRMPSRIDQCGPKDRGGGFVKSQPHRNERLNAVSEWPLADAVQLREFYSDLVASLDDCFEQLTRVGEVPVERTKRQTRPSGGLLNRGKHRFLGEHFQHDVEHRIDVALPPGLTAVEHLSDVLGIRHRLRW